MATHVYRSFAVKEAHDSGWTAFGTRLDKDSVWKAHYERGDNPADVAAAQHPAHFTHGEVSWIPGRTNDDGPTRIGLLIARCGFDHLAQLGAVEVDRTYARVFLTLTGTDTPMLVEHESGQRWGIFTPRVESDAYKKAVDDVYPRKPAKPTKPSDDREKPAAAPAPRRTATTATSPILNRSDGESPVKRVWAIADSMPDATRKEVVAACIAAGINKNTAGTQYFHWKKAKSAST